MIRHGARTLLPPRVFGLHYSSYEVLGRNHLGCDALSGMAVRNDMIPFGRLGRANEFISHQIEVTLIRTQKPEETQTP